jgi:heat shock protein HslJ
MRVRSLVAACLACFVAAGCSFLESTPPTGVKPIIPKPSQTTSVPFPFDRTMVAVRYKDQAFKDDRPTILISANYRGTGFSSCNNWSATILPRPDKRMAVGPVAISKRVCDQRLMHNEQVFLFVLNTAQNWSFDGKTLIFSGPYGEMAFESAV